MADNNIIFGEKALAFLPEPTATTPLGSGFPFCGPALSFLSFFNYLFFLNDLAAHIGVFSLGLSDH